MVAPEATVIEAGTVSKVLLLLRVTLEPPAGAFSVSVTVQELTALCPRLLGVHATPETCNGASRLMVAVWELLPSVAVIVPL